MRQMSQHEGGDKMFQKMFAPQRLFAPRAAVAAGRALYPPLIAQARNPLFFTDGRVPDTIEGRFEIYTLHLALLVRRLRGEGDMAAEVCQTLFDTFLDGLDDGLRQMGVGDLSVGKKMRKLGEAIYGRLKAYDDALKPDAAPGELTEVLARTVYEGVVNAPVDKLAGYMRLEDKNLANVDLPALLDGAVLWSAVTL